MSDFAYPPTVSQPVECAAMETLYVLHKHSGYGQLHYDLMIRNGQQLTTWQLMEDPRHCPLGQALGARLIQPHRLAYLEYQGPVSGHRGQVEIIDRGACQWQPGGLDGPLELVMDGPGLAGRWQLEPVGEDVWQIQRLGRDWQAHWTGC